MSIVCAVPGRMRLESRKLVGKRGLCLVLSGELKALEGVDSVDVNPRTGRVLIAFDDGRTGSAGLLAAARALMERIADGTIEVPLESQYAKSGEKGLSDAVLYAAADLAGHLLMPKPLNYLLPLAAHAMRRNH